MNVMVLLRWLSVEKDIDLNTFIQPFRSIHLANTRSKSIKIAIIPLDKIKIDESHLNSINYMFFSKIIRYSPKEIDNKKPILGY